MSISRWGEHWEDEENEEGLSRGVFGKTFL